MAIEAGQQAPDFTLKDQNNTPTTLSSFRGDKAVVLIFYPFAFSGICTGELCAIRDDLSTYENDRVQVLTVSCDTSFSNKVWSERDGYTFPMLSDFWPHGDVAKLYGVFNEDRGVAFRATFIIDTDGVVRWSVVNGLPDARDQSEYAKVLASL